MEDGIAHVVTQYPELAQDSMLVAEWQARQQALVVHVREPEPLPVLLAVEHDDDDELIVQAANLVREAVDSILPTNGVAESASVQAAVDAVEVEETLPVAELPVVAETLPTPEVVSEPVAPKVETVTTPVVQAATTREQVAQIAASSGLILVETSVGALIAAAARLDPPAAKVLRRADVPRVQAASAPVEMIQIETIRS